MEDVSGSEIRALLDFALQTKTERKGGHPKQVLRGKVVGLLFEKPSTRTRTSFETAIHQLGGDALYVRPDELQLSRGEPVKDTARVLGSYLDGIIARTYAHATLRELADFAPIPIINALSDLEHPTQIISDLLTILEVKGKLEGLKLAWIGDGNNVCNSWLLGGPRVGISVVAASPAGYAPEKQVVDKGMKLGDKSGASVEVVTDPNEAVAGADVIYTDVWVSMGQDKEAMERQRAFRGYQVNAELLSGAKDDVTVMHCLPAHRGLEITEDVLEGPHSIVWEQAKNKLDGARAILAGFMGSM